MLDLIQLFRDYRISPRGVIHIGAHEGHEVHTYLAMGFHHILFIEANPNVFSRLQANVAAYPQATAVHCAVSNRNGTETLHITNVDQSSSILPLKRHRDIYPDIMEVQQISVLSRTLDTLLLERNELDKYNFINIDIQGAELRVFEGAVTTLRHVEAINTEINFEELYEGCALTHQLDHFLQPHRYRRVATVTPFHPSWGDAFYVKDR